MHAGNGNNFILIIGEICGNLLIREVQPGRVELTKKPGMILLYGKIWQLHPLIIMRAILLNPTTGLNICANAANL